MEHDDGREFSEDEQSEYAKRVDELKAKEGPHGVSEEKLKKIYQEIAARPQM